uniref:ATP synthase complex subunit 8 n=1 Tax=Disteniidae sp. BMNH 899837 TaxID=1903814 RepID=A0A343A4E7_9CUCU|nr:ATP synthase F0 subunit 8 [Disteniidae sp. BMNH 899837]
MPQMAPLSWLNLFCLFVLIFLLFSILNFFNLNYLPPKKKEKSTKILKYNWKW